ncbi:MULTISPECIES: glycosyltransferase [Cyanophyceae]|uniref:glycosyltransferase n=1 Tax=Cyanophyceae TaxID=3028117 RepID=UPI0018EF5970|nr:MULTISPECIES: glycosyltransferase [Cyanophyceae]
MTLTAQPLPMRAPQPQASKPIRVLFVSHTYVVGVNQGKLDAIAQAGAEVGLLVPQHWQAPQWKKRFEAENLYPHIQLYPCPIYFEGRAGAHFYPPQAISKTIRDFKPDIIQVEEEVFSLVALEVAFWARRYRIPVVLFGWENRDRQLPAPRRWMRQYVFNSTQTILAGNHDGAELVKQWGYLNPVEVMPQMGVDTELFSPRLRPQKPSDAPLDIGFVGRIAAHKGIDTLIEAAHLLRQQGLEFCISLCGSGPDEAQFKQLAHNYNLDDVVVWTGGVRHDEVPQAMAKMDVLVLPSRTIPTWKEQFGHVLIEAMALGLPVVGSTCGEIPNVVGEPELVFPEGDAAALASILARLITDQPWRQTMATHSLNRVDEHYSHQRIAERSIELWRSIVQAG